MGEPHPPALRTCRETWSSDATALEERLVYLLVARSPRKQMVVEVHRAVQCSPWHWYDAGR